MLLKSETLLSYADLYKVVSIGGRYGGGKTLLAFAMAYELLRSQRYYYLLSNVKSVWNDEPAHVAIRDGRFVDAIIILDEGGLFIETGRDAKQFLAFLRKMNICILIPSVTPPPSLLRQVIVQRMMNCYIFGIPLWQYRIDLISGAIRENDWFVFWRPHKFYGIYDTIGAPSEDGGLNQYLKKWSANLQKAGGYKEKSVSTIKEVGALVRTPQVEISNDGSPEVAISTLEDIRKSELWGVVIDLQQAKEEMDQALSVFAERRKIRGR